MQIAPIRYNSKTNISHKGFAQDIKKLRIFDSDHRLMMLEKSEIRGINKPKNLKLVDELYKYFEGCLGCDIYRAYYAILDSNDEVNNYAKKTLLALACGKSTNIITNIKNMTKTGSRSIRFGLDHIADMVQACKDNKGNHHKNALDLLGELETQTLDSAKIPTYIEFCKDKNGQIDKNKVDLLKEFISKGYHIYAGLIAQLPLDKSRVITPVRLDLFNHIMEKYKNQEVQSDSLTFLQEILEGTKGDNDSELSIIDKNFDKLLNEDKTIRWGADYFKIKNGTIPFLGLMHMLNEIIPKGKMLGKNRKLNPDLFKDNSGCINKLNINQAFRLLSAYHYSDNDINELLKLKEMKDLKGEIDEKFINLILNNIFYCRETEYTPYPVDILKEVLRIAKNPDGTTNWNVANDLVNPVYILFKEKGKELYKPGIKIKPENNKSNSYYETYIYCSQLENFIKNGSGKFSEKCINELSELSKKDGKALIKVLTGKPIEEIIEGKNLYQAEELLKVLNELKETGRLKADILNAAIKDYDSLFWTIIDAPRTEENKNVYSQIMNLLSEVKGLDYNQKDKNEISVLEKVINAENEELLEIIIKNSDELHYYPELDWGVNNILDNKFKEKIKKLDLKFVDLEQSAKLCSVKTFDRLKTQLDSPLCDKNKVIEELFRIVKNQKGTIEPPDVYVYHLLDEYGGHLKRDLFNEMANWQISERTKRL